MKLYACIVCALCFMFIDVRASEDTELWTSVELQHEATKKLTIAGVGSLRLEEDASRRKALLGEFKLGYELASNLDIGVGFRHMLIPNNRLNRTGITIDVTPGFEVNDLDVSLRLRVRRYFGNGEDPAVTTWRPRLRLRLESKKDFRPYTFIEGIYSEDEVVQRWDALRLAFGFDYRFSGSTSIGWSLFFERELNRTYPDVREVFRVEFSQELW